MKPSPIFCTSGSDNVVKEDFPFGMTRSEAEVLIEILKRTGLARNVFIDEAKMRDYLEKHLGKDGAERFMIAMDTVPQVQEYNISKKYETQLTQKEERQYQEWKKKLPENLQNEHDYDLRGLWKENPNAKPDERLHLTSKYKKPNHITFSDVSIYHNPKAGIEGGKWVETMSGKWIFYASYFNISQYSRQELQDYFKEHEKDAELILPPEIRLMSTPNGEVYGFVTKEGDIYLDPNRFNANTVFHEFGHLWVSFVQQHHPVLWAKIKDITKETPYFKDVLNDRNYDYLKDDDGRADEAFNRALGDEGARIMDSDMPLADKLSMINRLRNLIKEFWAWVGQKLGIRDLSPAQIKNLTIFHAVIKPRG